MSKSDPIKFTAPPRSAGDRKKKLGKGLGALLGETKREEPLVRGGPSGEEDRGGDMGSASDSPLKSLSVAKISMMESRGGTMGTGGHPVCGDADWEANPMKPRPASRSSHRRSLRSAKHEKSDLASGGEASKWRPSSNPCVS